MEQLIISNNQQQQQEQSLISNKSLLSDKAILQHMEKGTVVISPFQREFLSSSSYDVTLGPFFYRESEPLPGQSHFELYNPYSEAMMRKCWGEYQKAIKYSEWKKTSGGLTLENIEEEDMIIWIRPGETILCHTNEFIGGRSSVSSMMKARSSWGRNFIEVCKCSAWSNIGYYGRWTMEVTNNSRFHSVPLVVGRRIAQIIFFDTDGVIDKQYDAAGKYQITDDIEKLKASWTPELMLPMMHKDKEIKNRSLMTFNINQYNQNL